ncbi:MAG: glycosyl hydrolase-related protein, partial [Anaerolineae bacterium]|nr:glycosyl hydrolase-related protein [Anaerolineae bacterium]
NVIIETVKPAEDQSGDIVVRLYEAKQMATQTTLMTTLPVNSMVLTDMLENPIAEVQTVTAGAIFLSFTPFQVKTVRLHWWGE